MAKNSNTSNIRSYNEAFLNTLEQLNSAQQTAVDHIEGPVMVIAGPGTGKTHILAARIGRILLETDTLAQNVLCLTFTDAGVHAMRDRLLQFIGPEAHRVHIYTFHSFCNTVIQDNIELFGRHDLEPISELEQIELFRKLIDSLDHDHPIKGQRNDPYAYERQLKDLILRMKSENWTVDFVLHKIDEYLTDLPNRPQFIYQRKTKTAEKGDIKTWKIEEERRKMRRLASATRLYPAYLKLMQRMRRYDYADMILWVVQAFRKHESLLRTYQERYLYFLIDEYQDTNGSQNEIIQQLIAYWENPNIFIVGDDDQSIFEFQGARLQNLVDFYQTTPELELVVLKQNYRSTQSILDYSKSLIEHNEFRIVNKIQGVEKALQSTRDLKNIIAPKIVSYPNRIQEAVDIVSQVEALRIKNIPLDEIAIIYAQHRQVDPILQLLDKKNIPYTTKRAVNILDLPLSQKLLQLLEYIDEEQQKPFSGEHRLFQIMHFDFFQLPLNDLAALSWYMAKHQYKDGLKWRSVLSQADLLHRIGLSQPEAFKGFSTLLDNLIRSSTNDAILRFIEQVINQTGLLTSIINDENKSWYLQALNTLFEFIKKEANKNPRLKLAELLETFNRMDANRLSLPIQKSITSEKGVNLVTAHSSKGLEFKYVFIIDAVKDFWEGRSKSGSQFSYPDTLTLSGETDQIEARRRLFYVAMTRAKSHLQISFALENADGKKLESCVFVDELLADHSLDILTLTPDPTLVIDAQQLQLQQTDRPNIPNQEKAIVDELLEGFALSISSLNRYLKCPLSFYYESVLKLPSVQSESASFGLAMHDALRRLFDKMRQHSSKQFPGLKEFLQDFTEEMQKLRAYFVKDEFDRRLQLGKQHLSQIYKANLATWSRAVLTEYSVRNTEFDGVPLVGTIDRIDLIDGQQAHIADYKTGSTRSQKISPPNQREPLGGIYWRQLYFYKILFELHQNTRKVKTAAIVYLEPDAKGEYLKKEIQYEQEGLDLVQRLIKETYANIKSHDFYEGCGEDDCNWCNFVQLNKRISSFADKEIEELDD